jgi:hypothetical protein
VACPERVMVELAAAVDAIVTSSVQTIRGYGIKSD